MFSSAFVCLSVCLPVCLSRKSHGSDLYENFSGDISVDNEELITFWNPPPPLDPDLGIYGIIL